MTPTLIHPLRHLALTAGIAALLVLGGCKTEVYQGLSESQANAMMTVLMKNGIQPDKTSSKKGFSLSVESDKVVQTLELMRQNNLPRDDFETLGKVFAAKGMISSATEERVRLSYAISQELSDTFSHIDGVLTSRVHIVLGSQDLASGKETKPSAAVFLRHTATSQAPKMVSRIRELASNAVPGLKQENVSVMLVPVRETITVPLLAASEPMLIAGLNVNKFMLFAAAILFVLSMAGLGLAAWMHLKGKPAEETKGAPGLS